MSCPAHIFLHLAHACGRFDVQTAGVEGHALAYDGDQGVLWVAPGDFDHAWRTVRGCGATDRMDSGVVGLKQGVTGDDPDVGTLLVRNFPAQGFDLQRSEVIGRGIDHVAS